MLQGVEGASPYARPAAGEPAEKFGNLFNGMVKKGTFIWVSGVPSVNAWSAKDGEVKAQINLPLKDFRILRGGKARDEAQSEDNPYEGEEE